MAAVPEVGNEADLQTSHPEEENINNILVNQIILTVDSEAVDEVGLVEEEVAAADRLLIDHPEVVLEVESLLHPREDLIVKSHLLQSALVE